MKVIIAGTRAITDPEEVWIAAKNSAFYITEIVCGMADGPDLNGRDFGMTIGVPVKEFPADWKKYKKAAGPIRNRQMGDYADALIAIWDGESRGTKHMIEYMRALDKPVEIHIVKVEYAASEPERSDLKDFL